MSEILRINGLTYTYPDSTPALHGIDLSLNANERLGLIGPNGSGKTTLLLHLNGLLRGGGGEVVVDGVRIQRDTLSRVRRAVGFLFQNPDDQLFLPTVAENIAFGMRDGSSGERDRRIAELLEMVGLPGVDGRNAWHLSLGEKRRVSLATLLSTEVKLLVLDEPTAGLDPRGQRLFADLLDSLSQPMIVASHDLALVERLCTRVAILDHGEIAADGLPADLLHDRDLLLKHGLA